MIIRIITSSRWTVCLNNRYYRSNYIWCTIVIIWITSGTVSCLIIYRICPNKSRWNNVIRARYSTSTIPKFPARPIENIWSIVTINRMRICQMLMIDSSTRTPSTRTSDRSAVCCLSIYCIDINMYWRGYIIIEDIFTWYGCIDVSIHVSTIIPVCFTPVWSGSRTSNACISDTSGAYLGPNIMLGSIRPPWCLPGTTTGRCIFSTYVIVIGKNFGNKETSSDKEGK